MVSATLTTVLAVEKIDPEDCPEYEKGMTGVISSRFVEWKDMDDDTLRLLWEQSPDAVIKHRPEWVKENYPSAIN